VGVVAIENLVESALSRLRAVARRSAYTCAMKARSPRPLQARKLDMGAFIDAQLTLGGELPLTDLPRLAEGLAPEVPHADVPPVVWQAVGELVPQRVGAPQMWLHLTARGSLPWTCQRCLQPVVIDVEVVRAIRFVADEATAAQMDAESDDDVLVVSRSFDLLELVEDELIMAAPIVPFHSECPQMPVMSVADADFDDGESVGAEGEASSAKPNPFAVLAQLKARNSGESKD
jgi:uncharacterized protein